MSARETLETELVYRQNNSDNYDEEVTAAIREVLDEADSYMRATDNLAHKLSAAEAEVERLRALKESIETQEHLFHGRIEAALALIDRRHRQSFHPIYVPTIQEDRRLLAEVEKALKGES